MFKQTEVHPCNGTPLSNKNKRTIDRLKNLDESLVNYAAWKKPIPKAAYCMTPLKYHCWNEKILEMEVRIIIARGQGKEGRGKEMVWSGFLAFGCEISNKYKTEKIFSKHKTLTCTDSIIPCLGTFGQTDTYAERHPNKDVDCMCVMAKGYRPPKCPLRGDQ